MYGLCIDKKIQNILQSNSDSHPQDLQFYKYTTLQNFGFVLIVTWNQPYK